MSTTGSRFFFVLCAFGVVAAVVYGLSTGGGFLGVFTAGYKGAVGEIAGYSILLALAVVAGLLGAIMSAFRDADPASVAEVAATDSVPRVEAPSGLSYWPIVASFGVAILILGAVTGVGMFVLGAVILVIAAFEWTVRAWSDRATGDPEVNRTIRNRFMFPIEIPVISVLVIGGVAIGFSRVFLALPQSGATIVAMLLASLVFGIAAYVSMRPKISRSLVSGILLAGGLAVLVGGVVSAGIGERDFEEHGEETEEHSEETEEHSEETDEPAEPGVTDEDGA